MMNWNKNIEELKYTLTLLSVLNDFGEELDSDKAFALWTEYTFKIRENRRTIYLIGNGASASMASHMAADLAKNAHIHTEVFSDLSLITAIANDISYEEVFAEPLRRRMVEGDMLVAVSSSGNSPNILRATEAAVSYGGIVVTLSAMNESNKLRKLGNLNFYVPAQTYGLAETSHAAIMHYWMNSVALK